MPFFANTPESLLGRSDSKNPSTTCRGITASGRPCRRPVAGPGTPPVARFSVAELRVDDPRDERLYCWQHKDQATLSAHSSPGPRMSSTPILEERTSLDTLADRLGIVAQQAQAQKPKRQKQQPQSAVGPPSRPHDGKQQQQQQQTQRPTKVTRPKPAKTVEFCCCFRIPIEEVSPPPRPKPRLVQPPASAPTPLTRYNYPNSTGKKPSTQHLAPDSHRPPPSTSRPSLSGQNSGQTSSTSQTAQYLALIPASTSPQTASLLMSELAKPVSRLDEPGYIYMFWLTPESQPSQPPADAARSLLTPPAPTTPTRPGGHRRPSDVLAAFSLPSEGSNRSLGAVQGSGKKNKILLKIGRATNVQRRLNEWTRQCGYNLSLIRYYPYVPSASPAAVPRKIPHSHKVERLIHIELAGRGMRIADMDKCDACGREHREWFEVDATRQGVADVDDVIRRWADWDEAAG